MKRDPDFPLVRNLVITLFATNGHLIDMGNRLVRPAGLTTAWWQVMGALGYAPAPLTVAQIARNMGLTRQGVQRVVDLLAARGYVALEPNPHHQRARLVALTAHGRAALEAAEGAAAAVDQRIIERIGTERLATALAVLGEMRDLILEELAQSATPSNDPTLSIENEE
ncbi:MarR family transcriptional regulator [Xaviernesmea oryzae]|uniref:MarR family transcriptional regulator n=1 Tax=Xaviernesmea oryzae TaxID=464029 RepID=A0A1Q9B1E9_9HYPH|nr:helix-turn-helix domain-containing protein [Xaviernesmea oryzae]OLP61835.1 MarR family transcriptional regulator [Xaviernesmea oryzae]SEL75991.1 DNA-binding transcriptional regulator, MarR family [Xaviernesmea oryzae]